MYTRTLFQFPDASFPTPTTINLETKGDEPHVFRVHLEAAIVDNRRAYIEASFKLNPRLGDGYVLPAWRDIEGIIRQVSGQRIVMQRYAGSGTYRYTMNFQPVSGQPLRAMLMEKYVHLMEACGTPPVPPRVLEETFYGNLYDKSEPEGVVLLRKALEGK